MSDFLVEHEVQMTVGIQSINTAAPHLRALIIPVEMWGYNLKLLRKKTPSACGMREKHQSLVVSV